MNLKGEWEGNMFNMRIVKLGLLAITLIEASCTMEPSTGTRLNALGEGRSSLDPPDLPVAEVRAAAQAAVANALVLDGRQVGYYDMVAGSGQPYQVAPIVAAGGTPINVFDLNAAELASLNVLWVHNPDNGGFGAEYPTRLPEIAAAVENGMVLVIHDRTVAGAETILPGGAGFGIFRDFGEATDINIRDASTAITAGLDNSSLDGGNFSNHGFVRDSTLPIESKLILTSTSNDRIVTFCYPRGRGAVIYSTIPLDFYLQGAGLNPPLDNLRNIYAPNVVKYAIAGACSQRNRPPVARCQDVTVDADLTCSAAASIDDGSFDPDNDTIDCTQSPAGPYRLGDTKVTLTCTDPGGLTSSCNSLVTVRDTQPPEFTLNPPTVLQPPNHQYHTFSLASCVQSITDQCSGGRFLEGTERITKVTSDEPDDAAGGGDGNTRDDMVITSATTVDLRAERQGDGDGRVYHVHFTVSDASGNTTEGSCPVFVPHDRGDATAEDSGVASCVGSGC